MNNRLPALAGEVATLQREIEAHTLAAADKALTLGAMLCEAKDLIQHGGWLPWLKEAGISERNAQRYMRLHRSGLESDMVSDLGGVARALSFLSIWKLPGAGEALQITVTGGDEENCAFIWEDPNEGWHYHAAAVVNDSVTFTRRSMKPMLEIEGGRPVDVFAAWLRQNGFLSMTDWHMEMVPLRVKEAVIDPLLIPA
jgi:hypothetical protein